MLTFAAWALGVLPAVIILQHAIYLHFYRRRFSTQATTLGSGMGFLEPALKSARRSEAKEFGLPILALRYGVPALLIALLDMAWFYFLADPPGLIEPFEVPMRLGALGAYVYVLMNLGQRNFRRDITSAVAVWCAVTLALGPVLAGVLNYLGVPGPTAPKPDSFTFGSAMLYFLAGLAPRYVASAIEESARRLLSSGGTTAVAPRTLPLTKIRGITPDIETRLGEEGIFDVYGLAMVSPNRLLRNTSFDARLIISWIDEALLMYYASFWEALENDGLTGAIDVAWYYDADDDNKDDQRSQQPPASEQPEQKPPQQAAAASPPPQHLVAVPQSAQQPSPPQPAPAGPPQLPQASQQDSKPTPASDSWIPRDIAALAKRINVDPQRLSDIVERVYQDAQVQQIWVLYQTGSNEVQPADGV